jgi:hypothetical protein
MGGMIVRSHRWQAYLACVVALGVLVSIFGAIVVIAAAVLAIPGYWLVPGHLGSTQKVGLDLGMSFSDDALSIDSAAGRASSPWSIVQRLRRFGDLFLLETETPTHSNIKGPMTWIVPRRAFGSDEDVARFSELANRTTGR